MVCFRSITSLALSAPLRNDASSEGQLGRAPRERERAVALPTLDLEHVRPNRLGDRNEPGLVLAEEGTRRCQVHGATGQLQRRSHLANVARESGRGLGLARASTGGLVWY